ncbi:MAG: MBL fold metallo-hydrolase [Akkermansiaceae bacterium]|nr:MBL fold metallo-hydrolase [Akkermansiaceae bacterium]
MLEDNYTDVIAKAMRGLGLSPTMVARRANLLDQELWSFEQGEFSEDVARRVARVLQLKPDALAYFPQYEPKQSNLTGVKRLALPFGDGQVNAWLIRTDDAVILFDTGESPISCAASLDSIRSPKPDHLFITHAHGDHVGGIPSMVARGSALHGCQIKNALEMNPGDAVSCGSLTVRAHDLSGHATPALGYQIDGLSKPVLVSGDALFAGSIGGCSSPENYRKALRNLDRVLVCLPDGTVILPGHGPATTLGEERANNPFIS